jgi:hypothetical protein
MDCVTPDNLFSGIEAARCLLLLVHRDLRRCESMNMPADDLIVSGAGCDPITADPVVLPRRRPDWKGTVEHRFGEIASELVADMMPKTGKASDPSTP